jgi:hypothetical protein
MRRNNHQPPKHENGNVQRHALRVAAAVLAGALGVGGLTACDNNTRSQCFKTYVGFPLLSPQYRKTHKDVVAQAETGLPSVKQSILGSMATDTDSPYGKGNGITDFDKWTGANDATQKIVEQLNQTAREAGGTGEIRIGQVLFYCLETSPVASTAPSGPENAKHHPNQPYNPLNNGGEIKAPTDTEYAALMQHFHLTPKDMLANVPSMSPTSTPTITHAPVPTHTPFPAVTHTPSLAPTPSTTETSVPTQTSLPTPALSPTTPLSSTSSR